jgi:hypothetical protein
MPASIVSAIAAEIDRLVVRGHELANESVNKPAALADMTALPHLLSTAAIVLLAQPLSRDAVKRVVPYTPPSLIDALIDNNISENVVIEQDGDLVLTDSGRAAASAVVSLQETTVAEAWSVARTELETIERLLASAVRHGESIEPPRTPSNFGLFAPHCDRPTLEGRVLRLMTAIRYWRADAHLRALADADLRPFEAHALNRLWDAERGVSRVGQGFPEPGSKGISSLEERGYADGGTITTDGLTLRKKIEDETDRFTDPVYGELDESSCRQLLTALNALPGSASPGIPGT